MPPEDSEGTDGLNGRKRQQTNVSQRSTYVKDLVNLDSDSDEQEEKAPLKGGSGPSAKAGGKIVIELCSSDDDEDDQRAAKRPPVRLPSVPETSEHNLPATGKHKHTGLHASSSWDDDDERDKPASLATEFDKQKAAPWSPPRPEFSDGPAGPSSGTGKRKQGAEKGKLSAEDKGKGKVGWSDNEEEWRRKYTYEDSGDESEDSGEEVDLVNIPKPARKTAQKRKADRKQEEVTKRQKVSNSGSVQNATGGGVSVETGVGQGGLSVSAEEEGLEGLDDKEKKKQLAERKKRQAAEAKAAKAEERERKREEQRLEKERKKLERQEARKQAAEEKRALKEQEKRQRAEQRDTYQKLTGKDALASCCVQIDPSLVGKDRLGMSLTLELQAKNLKYECAANPMKDSVTWRRIHYRSNVGTREEFDSQSQPVPESQPSSQVEGEKVDVPYVVLVYPAATFCDMVRTQALWRTLEEASRLHPGWTVCLLIPELRKYIKQRRAEDYKKADVPGHVPWVDPGVEEALAKLCIHYHKVSSCVTKDDHEAAEHIANLTRGHAEAPYRKESTVVGTFGGGNHLKPADKARLKKWPWLKGLTVMDGLSINVAEAIKQRYPTLRSLMDAYHDPNTTVQDKVGLLKDIPRTIGFGEGTQPGQETSRKVGPKLSEKVYRFLTARDPTMMIEEVLDK